MILTDYFEALGRLKGGASKIVAQGTLISNDSVSLEAGRKAGSIKKSRSSFKKLIEAIQQAADEQAATLPSRREHKSTALQKERDHFKKLYHEAVSRELSLLTELFELKGIHASDPRLPRVTRLAPRDEG